MPTNPAQSFFTRIRQKLFDFSVNREIFDRIFPHLQREKDHGYAFSNAEEMNEETERNDVQLLLARIDEASKRMPNGYGRAFRYILHRDLCEYLSRYETVARRRVNPVAIDSRSVAAHA